MNGTADAVRSTNLFAFAATLRGLLESTGDSFKALDRVPMTLAENAGDIHRCLTSDSDSRLLMNGELESILINFAYGRRLKKGDTSTFPESHRADESQSYVSAIERHVPRALESVSYSNLTLPMTYPV